MNRNPQPTPPPRPVRPEPEHSDGPESDEREGATERDVGDRTGPGAGYDNEPEQESDDGGVS